MRWRPALAVVAIWTAAALLTASHQYATRMPDESSAPAARLLLASLLSAWVWAAFTPAIVALARRAPVTRDSWRRTLPVHVAGALAFAALDRVLLRALLPWSSPFDDVTLLPFATSYLRALGGNVVAYVTVAAVVHAVRFSRLARERELEATRLAAQLSAAQLDALRAQLHPHFLFNALHSASMLTLYDAPAAHQVLVRLSALLRRTLGDAGRAVVPLREELDLLEQYLGIARVRFGDRLRAQLEADDDVLDAPVPGLLLQPLVENALRHAVEPRAGGGTVTVRAHARGEWLEIEVEDDGPGPPADGAGEAAGGDGGGLGLPNVRARLRAAYGARQSMALTRGAHGGAHVRVRLPLAAAGATVPVG